MPWHASQLSDRNPTYVDFLDDRGGGGGFFANGVFPQKPFNAPNLFRWFLVKVYSKDIQGLPLNSLVIIKPLAKYSEQKLDNIIDIDLADLIQLEWREYIYSCVSKHTLRQILFAFITSWWEQTKPLPEKGFTE